MRSVIESEMPLIVAIQHSKSGMFSKFHFTCFEWIIHGKLFHSPSFNLKNLCAAGTEEGPILLISKLTQSIVPVCLLCVHKRKVTDIVMSHQLNTFLSVSADGSIAGWHCSDGSCCFAYDNLVPQGEIKIVLCESDTSLAWFWTRGESASLVDLKRGTVSQKINFIGLSSFSILKKNSNFISNSPIKSSSQKTSKTPSLAIMAGINTLRTYQINETTNFLKCQKVEEIEFSLDQKYNITPNGIVVTKKNLIKIYLPNLSIPIYTENIIEISDDDSIATVSWKHPESLLISSFKGIFKIYKFQTRKSENTQHISIQKVQNFSCQDCFIFSNVAFNSDIGCVIFSSTKDPYKSKTKNAINQSTVNCLTVTDQKVVKLVIPQIDKLCCIPNSNSRIVVQAEQRSSTFQIFDWGLSTSISQSININKNSNTSTSNIQIDSQDYKGATSRSSISMTVNAKPPLKQIPSSSEVRNYSLFGKQFPLSQSVDFRSNLNQQSLSSFVLREGSIGHWNKTAVITAICCQNFNNLSTRLQIICGASDGKLYFFWENNALPFEISDALISPVIAIVLLPIKFTKTSCLIAVGRDGSFCLFKWNKLSHRYVTNGLPIVAIGIIETQRLLVIQKSDNSFSIYDLNSPEMIAVMLMPPPKTIFIWSIVNFSTPTGIQSTLSLQIAGSSLFYSVLEVSKLKVQRKATNRLPIPVKSANFGGDVINEKQQNSKGGLTQKLNEIAKPDVNNSKSEQNDNEKNNTEQIKIARTNTQELVDYLVNPDPNERNVFTDHSLLENQSQRTDNQNLDSKTRIESNSNKNPKTNLDSKSNESSNQDIKQSPNDFDEPSSCTLSLPGVANSVSDTNLQNNSTAESGSILNSLPKSNSNSNVYSNTSSLVRKVNTTDSSSDSTANSDSPDDFYTRNAIQGNPMTVNHIDTVNTNFFSLRDTITATSTATTDNLDDSLSKISVVSKSDITDTDSPLKKEDSSLNPISQTGCFTTSNNRSIVAVILEMMVPTLSNSNGSGGSAKSRSFAMTPSHPSLVINSSVEKSKWCNVDENQDCLSFVLVGHRNLPTFFYPMFKLSGPTVFDTSPFNAALHYLSYKIMSNYLNMIPNTEKFEKENKFKICGFISILTQLLFINDTEIQRISALTCDKIVNWSSSGIVVPEQVWNLLVASYIQYFDKNNVADYDKFLMAIMMVTHADLVDPIYHRIVFDFILKIAQDRSPSSFLAFNILVANFDLWADFYIDEIDLKKGDDQNGNKLTSHIVKRGKKELMNFLLSNFFNYNVEDKKLVKEKLYLIIKENFNSFCESIRFLLFNNPTEKMATETCQICSEIAEEHPLSIGSLGPLFIAYLADGFEKLQHVFSKYLKEIQVKFKDEIVYVDQLWIFATNDGFIHVFKNMKTFFNEKISDGPILTVSIGPNAACAAAITKNDLSLVKIDLKSSFFLNLNKKRIIERENISVKPGIPYENIKIVWDNKDSCHIDY